MENSKSVTKDPELHSGINAIRDMLVTNRSIIEEIDDKVNCIKNTRKTEPKNESKPQQEPVTIVEKLNSVYEIIMAQNAKLATIKNNLIDLVG